MLQIELTEEEKRILIEILDATVGDLRMEIADTDAKDFRDRLKIRKQTVLKVLDALRT
jgi:hypothetical protein